MTANRNPACEIRGLKRSFGSTRALASLTLDLFPGDIALLLGPNGAGKSTLLRICSGLAQPDEGSVNFIDCAAQSTLTTKIGYVDHQLLMYSKLTLREHLLMQAKLMHLDVGIDSFLECWGLEELSNRPIETFSKGQQARASLCRAFLPDPCHLFLDEPTAALDDAACQLLQGAINKSIEDHGGTGCALIATHDVARLINQANRIIVVQAGLLAHDSAPEGASRSTEGSLEEALAVYRGLNR